MAFLRQCSRVVVFPMRMGRGCPSCRGGQYLFDVEKVPKDAMGLRPLVPPCIKKLCVKPWGLPPNPQILSNTEVVVSEGRLLRSRTKPNQARLLSFGPCSSVPSLLLTSAGAPPSYREWVRCFSAETTRTQGTCCFRKSNAFPDPFSPARKNRRIQNTAPPPAERPAHTQWRRSHSGPGRRAGNKNPCPARS